MEAKVRVLVWNEFRHEKLHDAVSRIYPDGIHAAIAAGLGGCEALEVRTAILDEPEHGLTEEVLQNTDVLTWWAHMAHQDVDDAIVERVYNRVQEGMGIIVLHSGHFSKIFRRLMGTHCSLKWREKNEKVRVWNIAPSHPITQGIPEYFELANDEMYGEPFAIPEPEATLFISWFEGGEVFRSGCIWRRGAGRVFYFCPGHETYPVYYNPTIIRILQNASVWAAGTRSRVPFACPHTDELETIAPRDIDLTYLPDAIKARMESQ